MANMALPSLETSISASSSAGYASTPRNVRSRTQSISSDRPSTIGHSLMSPPLAVSPEAAFIAASAASQIVTYDHDGHSESWYDEVGIEPAVETALVSTGALQLANNFVDQLLFNIIAVARSTSLSALRPAVSEVLKPKLAKDAINQADVELREYLGGGDVEEMIQSPTSPNPRDWDLELVWKRTRLRCMVYSSLGDMEEEDEDYYMEQEHLQGDDDHGSEVVSPAVAIFLTSILEFMGEQVLVVSGQAAFNRLRARCEKELKDGARVPGDVAERIIVEELDMERVALDRTLGRLWRSWKKRVRSPFESNYPSRPFSRSSNIGTNNHSRRASSTTEANVQHAGGLKKGQSDSETEAQTKKVTKQAEAEVEEYIRAASIALPIGYFDVEEIEHPGLVSYSDDDDDESTQQPRPKSLMIFSQPLDKNLPTPTTSQLHTPVVPSRKRSNSLPTPGASPYQKSQKRSQDESIQSKLGEEGTRKVRETEVEQKAEEVEQPSGIVPKVVAGAAAIGTAAIAGVAAIVQGSVPQTEPEASEGELTDLDEEPQIMTSSRMSIAGRSSSPTSEAGRSVSTMPARSNSVHSLRVIDVHGPRSPTVRSRNPSVDTIDRAPASRPSNLSRDNSVSTPPIDEEGGFDKPAARKNREAIIVPQLELPPKKSTARKQPQATQTPPRSESPVKQTEIVAPAPTKVTIVDRSVPAGSSFLDLEDKPEPPQKVHQQVSRNQPLPSVPEVGASRATSQSPTTIGRPSIERQIPRGVPESPKRTRAPSAVQDSPSSSISNKSKYKAVRGSEESTRARPEDVARNFEELIQSNQTLQYTLTPENMRDLDTTRSNRDHSPVATHKSRRSEDVKQVDRSRSSSLNKPLEVKRSASISRSTGLNSHPPNVEPTNGKLSGPIPRSSPPMPSKARSAASQPRDARVPRESVNDFADFIRSTGPPGDYGAAAAARAAPTSAPRNYNNSVTTNTTKANSIDGRPSTSSTARNRLQARDASVTGSNGSSELIDFIRRGPPNSGGDPRIPRHVAPFRSTGDSDQMSGAVGGKAVDAMLPDLRNSQTSNVTDAPSVKSSINSQSALLKTQKPLPQRGGADFDDDDGMPKRTRRRIRDPYAIDLSDEDEDDLEDILPKPKPKQQEESLADFLKNYSPPPEPTPAPIVPSKPKKKASAPNLLARLRPGFNSSSNPPPPIPKNNGYNPPAPRAASSGKSNGRGYTPIIANIPTGADNYGGDSFVQPSRTTSNSTGRVPMKKFEPREAASTGPSKTSDLAKFLRDSAPPPTTTSPNLSLPSDDSRSGGFSKMFDRKKKTAV